MAHGFLSDRTSSGRFPEIARALNAACYNALAFDFSGCGESDDDSLSVAKQVDDLEAAVAYAKASGFGCIAFWGNSLGCRICLQAEAPQVEAMVLTGCCPGAVQYRWAEHFTVAQLAELEATGFMTETFSEGLRCQIVVPAEMLADFATFDQARFLGRVRCPVLIVNGDGDAEERQYIEISRAALRYLPKASRHEIIAGAAHGFWGYLDQVRDLGLGWLRRHMPI